MRILLTVLMLVLLPQLANAAEAPLRFDFSAGLKGWDETVFKGHVDYRLVEEAGRQVLRADSRGNASGLVRRIDVDPQLYPVLRWRWKVDGVLPHGWAGKKAGDDFPARVYVIFDAWVPIFARTLNYIWANRVPQDSLVVNPFYSRALMLAVESGTARAGRWVVEERNLQEDYRRAFGGDMPRIKAVAVMSDGDNTGESARAWFDWIEFLPAIP